MKKKVVIVEDNITLATGFKEIINNTNFFTVEDVYFNAEDAINRLEYDYPDIVLMDIELPKMNGVEATKKIKSLKPNTLILIVTVYENSETVFDALCAGASGYLTKNASSNQLIEAMSELVNGGSPMSMKIARMVVQSFQKKKSNILNEQEIDILTQLSRGKSYQGIAEVMCVSVNTIKYHIKKIYDKLEVSSKDEALSKANKQKII